MFERFTKEARNSVVLAQEEARRLGDRHIGTEHLLLTLARGEGPAAEALRAQGVEPDVLRGHVAKANAPEDAPLDTEALKSLGIDLDAVRDAVEESFGEGALDAPAGRFSRSSKGHLPFSGEAKKSLELSLRHAVRLKQKRIEDGHVLLGVIHDRGFSAVRVLADAGVDVDALRSDITRRLTAKAA